MTPVCPAARSTSVATASSVTRAWGLRTPGSRSAWRWGAEKGPAGGAPGGGGGGGGGGAPAPAPVAPAHSSMNKATASAVDTFPGAGCRRHAWNSAGCGERVSAHSVAPSAARSFARRAASDQVPSQISRRAPRAAGKRARASATPTAPAEGNSTSGARPSAAHSRSTPAHTPAKPPKRWSPSPPPPCTCTRAVPGGHSAPSRRCVEFDRESSRA